MARVEHFNNPNAPKSNSIEGRKHQQALIALARRRVDVLWHC
ncbi:hypothetical protein ACN263_10995 [Micromonospora sp. WMMD729]